MSDKVGYKGHRFGSAKGKVHQVFDEKGKDAAIKKAEALGKAESTARTWVSEWTNGTGAKKAKKTVKREKPAASSKKAAKANARKPVKSSKKKAAKKAPAREKLEA